MGCRPSALLKGDRAEVIFDLELFGLYGIPGGGMTDEVIPGGQVPERWISEGGVDPQRVWQTLR